MEHAKGSRVRRQLGWPVNDRMLGKMASAAKAICPLLKR